MKEAEGGRHPLQQSKSLDRERKIEIEANPYFSAALILAILI